MHEFFEHNDFERQRAQKSAKEFEQKMRMEEFHFIDLMKVDEIYNYYVQLNELGKAQELVRYAIQSHPASGDLYHKLSRINFEFGRFRRALQHIETAIQYSPLSDEYRLFKADLLARMERYHEAQQLLEELLISADRPEDIYLQMGNIAQICSKPAKSEEYYRLALEISPAFEEALFELAFLLESEEKTEESAGLYEKYLDSHPYSPVVLV